FHNTVLSSYRGFPGITFLLIATPLSHTPANTGRHRPHNPRPGLLIASETYYRNYSKKLTHIHGHISSFKLQAFLSADRLQFTAVSGFSFSNIHMHAAVIPSF
ncbi:MAG: hypothetical protein RSF79_03250, partial [Janthinobacterium sp.]